MTKKLAVGAAMFALALSYSTASAYTVSPYMVAGSNSTELFGVNDHGVLVGSYDNGGFIDDHGTVTMVNLPGSSGYVAGISNDGTAVGGDYTTSFIYKAGVLTPFDLAGWDSTMLRGISLDGRYAAGAVSKMDGETGGFVLDMVTGHVSMFSPPTDSSLNVVQGVNDSGVAVGSLNFLKGSLLLDGVTNTSAPFIAPGDFLAVRLRAINDLGDVAGYAYDKDFGMVSFLDTVSQGVITFSFGSSTNFIYGLNDSGLAVGSYADNSDRFHGFVVTLSAVPEPAPAALLILALAAGSVVRNRRKVSYQRPQPARMPSGGMARQS